MIASLEVSQVTLCRLRTLYTRAGVYNLPLIVRLFSDNLAKKNVDLAYIILYAHRYLVVCRAWNIIETTFQTRRETWENSRNVPCLFGED